MPEQELQLARVGLRERLRVDHDRDAHDVRGGLLRKCVPENVGADQVEQGLRAKYRRTMRHEVIQWLVPNLIAMSELLRKVYLRDDTESAKKVPLLADVASDLDGLLQDWARNVAATAAAIGRSADQFMFPSCPQALLTGEHQLRVMCNRVLFSGPAAAVPVARRGQAVGARPRVVLLLERHFQPRKGCT